MDRRERERERERERKRERERERYADVVPSEAEGLGDIILLLCFFFLNYYLLSFDIRIHTKKYMLTNTLTLTIMFDYFFGQKANWSPFLTHLSL